MTFSQMKLVLPVGAVCAALTLGATDYWVSPDGTGDGLSREEPAGNLVVLATYTATRPGDVIHLLPGAYDVSTAVDRGEYGGKRLEMEINTGVTVVGTTGNPADVVLDAKGLCRVAWMKGTGCRIQDVTIRNGRTGDQGGGLCTVTADYVQRDPRLNYTVDHCVIENCVAEYQGGAGNGGRWTNCTIRACQAVYSQAYAGHNAPCNGWGGGVFGGELVDCTVADCYAYNSGGAVAGGTDNVGHIYPLFATGCMFSNCWANCENGGGAAGYDLGDVNRRCNLTACTIVGNQARRDAFVDHDALGGGISGTYAERCEIRDNFAGRHGGGAWNVKAVGCVFRGNRATSCGGAGIECAFEDCALERNVAGDTGGAAYNCSSRRCTVLSNTSGLFGALYRGHHVGDVVCFNEAVRNDQFDNGGALGADASGHDALAESCTFFWNAGGGAAVANAGLRNCIIWGQGGQSSFRDLTLMENCYVYTTENAFPEFAVNCRRGDFAGFVGEKANREDPVATMRALEGVARESIVNLGLRHASPGVNAGVNADWMDDALDLLGTRRIREGVVDIGAFECSVAAGMSINVR